jgi:hypothetical protein
MNTVGAEPTGICLSQNLRRDVHRLASEFLTFIRPSVQRPLRAASRNGGLPVKWYGRCNRVQNAASLSTAKIASLHTVASSKRGADYKVASRIFSTACIRSSARLTTIWVRPA